MLSRVSLVCACLLEKKGPLSFISHHIIMLHTNEVCLANQPTSQFFIRGGGGGLGAVQPSAKGHTEIQPDQLAKLSVGISPTTDRPNVELCFAASILIPHVWHYYGGYYYCCWQQTHKNT